MNKCKFSLLLIFFVLLQIVPIFPHAIVSASTYSTSTAYYDGTHKNKYFTATEWEQVKIDYNIPALTPRVDIKNLPFNIELWKEKNIIVYGDFSAVSSTVNDFKNATGDLDAEGKYIETPNKGYYESGTGEYRYHGYDANHSLYTNGDFPIDANSGMKATAKNWIYRIWDQKTPYYSDSRIKEASLYNQVATGTLPTPTKDKDKIQKWINDGIPFEISNTNNTDKSGYNYAQVLTPPTTRMAGETLMYHLSKYDGNPWYQVFSLTQIKAKEITPVEATVTIIGVSDVINNGKVDKKFSVKVDGLLLDEAFYADDILMTSRYTRDDIGSWSMELKNNFTPEVQTLVGKRTSAEAGSMEFTVVIPYDTYEPMLTEDEQSITPIFTGKATCIFTTGDQSSETATTSGKIEALIIDEKDQVAINITAPHEMLDTEKFKIVDSTTGDDFTRTVELNGAILSEAEADEFLSGNHLFPLIGEDKVYTYSVTYLDNVTDHSYAFMNYILVYTTKPKAQMTVTGTFKENRLISASSDIGSVNSAYLMANASITPFLFDATTSSGNNGLVKFGTKNTSNLAFIVKGQEQVNIQIRATATVNPSKIERSDIPSGYHTSNLYTYTLYTLEDYTPSLIANVWNGTLTRNETLDFYYDAVSTDNDLISVNTYKILFDANDDGVFETVVKQGNYADFTAYQPSSLGHYKIIFYAEETFGQPTLAQFITADDQRTFTLEREFYVDNLAPMTKLFTDIEYDFPQADVIVLNDQEITRELNNSIVSERVNWINGLRQSSVDASVQVWDLYTYIYSQSASTTVNSGGSTPPATTSYSSGGYSGTLSKYNTVNNQYQVDNGYYKTVTDTIPISDSQSQTGTATYTYTGSSWYVSQSYGMTSLPSTISYNSGGYVGTMSKSGGGVTSDDGPPSGGGEAGDTYSRTTTWEAIYTGTASKSVQVWQSNWVWYNDYTGYYSGTIYKNVKQAFTPTFRINSDKYLVYFADGNINNQVDIQAIKDKGTVKVIMVGKASTKSLLTYDYYIDSSKTLSQIMGEVNTIVADANPYENKQLVQVGETFMIQKADYDQEGDPITDIGYEYVQDANYYDNSMGLEIGAVATYSDSSYTSTLKSSFTKVGHYKVFRKIKDIPTDYPSYTKDSNVPQLDIYVHRKPIADFTLDWDYDSASSSYKTTWVDKSYDLDHQFSDPDKGITDRKIMYRKTSGDNVWHYAIPDNLTSGTYELRYTVKDLEGAWNDEITRFFTLSVEPPVQLKAKIRSISPPYETYNIPASEKIQVFEIITNYHEAHNLRISIYDINGLKLKDEALLFSSNIPNYNIKGNVYEWQTHDIEIPEIYQDDHYKVKLEAYAVSKPSIKTTLDLDFHVQTPVTIIGDVDELVLGEVAHITAHTNKYANKVNVVLFKDTSYQTTVSLNKSSNQLDDESITWENEFLISEVIPEDQYTFAFTAQTPSGNQASYQTQREVIALKIKKILIEGYWNHWRGQIDAFDQRMTFNPHRFLSYEKVKIRAEVIGEPDEVFLNFSPELEAMVYINKLGQTYRYQSEVGYEPTFPIQLSMKSGNSTLSIWEGEYILPLARETMDWQDIRLASPYSCAVTAIKGNKSNKLTIDDIEITGNIYDLLYHQPKYNN
ncbi:hypothetical protein QE109_14855 [Fusibacter bizertensis]|uniref:Uncharacterized protein n=1 Tax=Fusibacter bizertensis TaxID=1488331 RepID=A0ABT6NG94_9FIRM|nr:hypothetical protein [Fusibacter bizertensis]MDH8679436.1 hypothetical protein [Fusibacter bizertensis]